MLKMLLTGTGGKPYSVQDIRKLQKKLKQIEPQLRTQFMREVKQIAKEPQKAIRDAIPTTSPLSGMTKPGATLQWGKVSKGAQSGGAKSTTIRFRTQAGGRSLTTTLVGIRVNSAATSVADMAGRSGRYVGRGYKGSGYSRPIRRTYSDGAQSVEFRRQATRKAGTSFIRNLNAGLGQRPSRMAWKSVEKSLPRLSSDIQYIINKWAITASRGF
jgi:hypothetical protein